MMEPPTAPSYTTIKLFPDATLIGDASEIPPPQTNAEAVLHKIGHANRKYFAFCAMSQIRYMSDTKEIYKQNTLNTTCAILHSVK